MKKPTYEDLEQRIKELESPVVENKHSSHSFLSNINIHPGEIDFLECLDLVGRAMNQSKNVDHIIGNAIDAVFSFFGCDRVWVFYPCDPDSSSFYVLAEKNKPEYPGAFHSGQNEPITPEAAQTTREALASGSPVVYDPDSGNKVNDVAAKFSVHSQMMKAVHPKSGKPWMIGMHQCSYARIWTKKEQLLFNEISNRVVEGLSNIILQKNLRKSEKKYRDLLENLPQKIFHKDKDSVYISRNMSYAKDLKIEAEHITGTTDYDYFPKDLADKYRRDDKRIIETGTVGNISRSLFPKRRYSFLSTVPVYSCRTFLFSNPSRWSRQVLHRWTQNLSLVYALPQLLALYCGGQVEGFFKLTPWQKKNQITAGRVRLRLRMILGNIRIREWWNPTCRTFQPPFKGKPSAESPCGPQWLDNVMSKNNVAVTPPPPPG